MSIEAIIINNMADYGTDGTSALAPKDPYNNMDKPDPKPKFGLIRRGQGRDSSSRNNASPTPRQSLNNAERVAATKPISVIGGGFDQANNTEQNQPFYNKVQGLGVNAQSKKRKAKASFKNKGPLIAIMTLLIGGGGLMAGTQALMPFSLVSQFQEAFDTLKTVGELRSNAFLRYQLDPDRTQNPIRATMFGRTKFKISSKQKTKLSKQGITVEENFQYRDNSGNIKNATVLRFDDGSGFEPMYITPNNKVKDAIRADFESRGDFRLADSTHTFSDAFNDINDFRNGYISGSRTWRGSIGAWFSSTTVNFLQSNKITRNLFKNFQERVRAEEAGNTRSAAIEMMRTGLDEDQEVGVRNTDAGDQDDGNIVVTAGDPDNNNLKGKLNTAIFKSPKNKADIEANLKEFGNKTSSKASGIASATVNIACTVFNFFGAVNLLVFAYEGTQILQLVSSYLEAIQKVQAGDGADSPLNDLANGLTAPADTTNDEGEVIRSNMSAMSSSGITALYGNKAINQNDQSVSSFAIGAKLNTVAKALGSTAKSFLGCSLAKAAANLTGAILDIFKIAACAATFGVGCVVSAISDAAGSIASSIGISGAIQTASSLLAPAVFKIFSRDLISALAGEDLGNALVSGANMYMGSTHKAGGGSPTNAEDLKTFISAHQEVIANEARYQRETRSPFDTTSKYTFMGSIVTSLVAFGTQASSLTGAISGVGNIISTSITSILPSTSALTATNTIMSLGDCPDLEAIGAVGDAFCNPYIVSDLNTINEDPAIIIDSIDQNYNGFVKEESEIPKIDENSTLAKYIAFCTERSSPFGVTDQNIVSQVESFGQLNTDSSVANTTVNSAVGVIPVIGDVVDLISSSIAIDNRGWVSGESCVQGNTVSALESPDWQEVKLYQRFFEDQTLAESMCLIQDSDGNCAKSSVTAFLNKYYEKNPQDNSYEGILARKTGMTKDDVIATLDQLEYHNFLATYDPTELSPMADYSAHFEASLADQLPSAVIGEHSTGPAPYFIIYADTRTRNFAV